MQDVETQDLISGIISQAEAGEHTKLKLITSWEEYKYYLKRQKALKIVLKILRTSINSIFKAYCKDVAKGEANYLSLLAHSQLKDILGYYIEEFDIVRQMNDEYDEYLGNLNNFFLAILGYAREV